MIRAKSRLLREEHELSLRRLEPGLAQQASAARRTTHSYTCPMITKERFRQAVGAASGFGDDVTLSGFVITIHKRSRSGRSSYELTAVYDPDTNYWSLSPGYPNSVELQILVDKIQHELRSNP